LTGIISDNVGRPSGLIKAASGGGGGVWTLIKTLTASSSSTLSFVNGTDGVVLDSTYPIYRFSFINIHPSAGGSEFQVGFRDGGTDYDATKTTTVFYAYHFEGDQATAFEYNTSEDLSQSTAFQDLTVASQIGTDNDECASGSMTLFNPSSTTFAKHFMSRINYVDDTADPAPISIVCNVAGYCNVTAAIDAVQFKLDTNNIQSGKIKLYGMKDSA
jgi:hypothetical protein